MVLHDYKAGVEAYLAQSRRSWLLIETMRLTSSPFGRDILIAAARSVVSTIPNTLRPRTRNSRRARQDRIDAALQGARVELLAFPISLPVGKAGGLPVGFCLVGTAWSEPTLIRVAFGLEQRLALGRDAQSAWRSRVA